MKKQILSLALAAAFILAFFPVTLAAQNGKTQWDYLNPSNPTDSDSDFRTYEGFVFKTESGTPLLDLTFENPVKVYSPAEKVYFRVKTYDTGCQLTIKMKNIQTGNTQTKPFTISANKEETYDISLPNTNGLYEFTAALIASNVEYSASVQLAAVPKNNVAGDDFLFGIQTYMARPYYWGPEYGVPGTTEGENMDLQLKLIDILGVNCVRDGADLNGVWMENGEKFEYMKDIVKKLSDRGITLNWTIGGTPDWAAAGTTGDTWKQPPDLARYSDFIKKLGGAFANWDNIIYEIYNEPNNAGEFWAGTAGEYLETLNAGAQAILYANKNAVITNGGLITENGIGDNILYSGFNDLIKSKTLGYISVHSHGTLQTLSTNAKNIPNDIDKNKLFLNESGADRIDVYGNARYDQFEQAEHSVAKMIWAKANGLAGYSLFTLGGLNPSKDANRDICRYSIVSNDTLEPQAAFVAYATAIKMLDGYQRVKSDGDNTFVFAKGKSEITVSVGGGVPEADYIDMFGNKNGSATNITYTRSDTAPTGNSVEVTVDVTVTPTVKVTITIYFNGTAIYEGTFPK